MRFEMTDCGGCRTCAMACSYKFTGEFNSDHAAIRIIEREDGMGFDVELVDDEGEEYLCDGCLEYDTPLCVQFCHFKEELTSFINILLESKKEGQDHDSE